MARTTPIVAVILATLLALSPVGVAAAGGPAPAATAADDGIDRGATATAPPDNDSSVNVSVGQQLSTVVAVTDDEIQGDFEETELEVELESDNESERAEAIAERAEELRERAETIREEYRGAVEAYREGELTRSEFAQRLAVLNSRAERVLEGYDSLQDRAANVSDLELRSAGLNRTAVRSAVSDLDSVTGAGPDALLSRFTGATDGEVEIENDSGLSISVESEDGERSREIERPGDGDANLTVDASEALNVARGSLTETNGTWTLETLTVDAEDGVYGFEFELVGDGVEGDAEIDVDGSSGDVVALEEKIEVEGDDEEESDEEDEGDDSEESDEDESDEEENDEEESDEEESDEEESDEEDDDSEESDEEESDEGESEDDEDESDDGDEVQRELILLPVEGEAAPNGTVTVRALLDGEPASNLTVTMNYEVVGTTDENGELTVTLPDGDATLRAELDDESVEAEAETEYEFGDADEERDREDEEQFLEAFQVDASLDNGTVDLTVAYEGSPVADATVYDDGERVGTTDGNGTLAFDTDATEELELTVERGELEVELSYLVDGDSLTLEEADVDVGDGDEESDDEGDEEEGDEGEGDEAEGDDEEGDDEGDEDDEESDEGDDDSEDDGDDSDDEDDSEDDSDDDGDDD